MASVVENPAQPSPEHFMTTSGALDPVWIHTEPASNRPKFPKLDKSIGADVCIIGSGIAGIQTAYELVMRGANVVMLEAREILSGETGRTSGHLSSGLDAGYIEIAKKHGDKGAAIAAESHEWAINKVGEVSKKLGIECEYRKLPAYEFSQYDRKKNPKEHEDETKEMKEEVVKMKSLGMDVEYREGLVMKGWDGIPDQRDVTVINGQATFHPTKYLIGVLTWLKDQPNFQCFTHTRVMDIPEKGIEIAGMGRKTVEVKTEDGHVVSCSEAVQATCVPLHKLSVVVEMEFHRTYCIAIKMPKGDVEDALLYDMADPYKYTRMTHCDDEHDYMVVGGCDHKVGQEEPVGRFKELEEWARARFTKAGDVDYAWSGQIFEAVDHVAFIGRDPGTKHTFIVTGDCGNGLTHGMIASRIIANEIEGKGDPWSELYSPSRVGSILKSAGAMLSHDLQINSQFKRLLQTDIHDIEDLPNGEGGVLNVGLKAPIAVYKDDQGGVHKFSALCPHLKGVVCWNKSEKSWDCPIHGSRFSKDGICVMGPSKANLPPADDDAAGLQKQAGRT